VTVEISISVPDDVASYLQEQGNASAAVTDAVRRILPTARRERQRAAAQVYGEFLRARNPHEVERDRLLIETSNDLALRDAEW